MNKQEVLNNIIRHRRSVFPKNYTGEIIDEAIIKQILENARWAPNHKFTEPWHFIVYTGAGLKKLGEQQAEIYKQHTEANNTFKEDRYENLKTKPSEASHIIAVCMKRDPLKRVPEVEEMGAVYCAVQNMYLTASAYGIGCYLGTGGITYFEESKALFGLGEEDKFIGFLYLGIPKDPVPDSRRNAIEEKTVWER